MRFRDRLADTELRAVTDFAKEAHELLAQLCISAANQSAAITTTIRTVLAELAERGQLDEEVRRRILAQTEADLAQGNELVTEARESIVRLVSRFEPRAGFADRVKLFYEDVFLPWWDDDSF